MIKPKENYEWIDILKGFAISSVIVAHVIHKKDIDFILLYVLPLFFIIAGYLYKPNTDYKTYASKKAFHLLLPYTVFILFLIIPFNADEFTHGLRPALGFLYRTFIGGRNLTGIGAVFYFITSFYATQQIFNWIYTKIKNPKLLLLIILLLLFISYINSECYPKLWIAGNINLIFFSIPLFYTGYLLKKLNLVIPTPILLLSTLMTIATLYFFPNTYSIDMKYAIYGIPLLSFIASCTISYFFIQCSIYLQKYQPFNTILSSIGQASMTIMYLHQTINSLMRNQFHIQNHFLIFTVALFVTWSMHQLFLKFKFTRALLLGSEKDFKLSFCKS